MPPSDRAMRRLGNLRSTGENNRSVAASTMLMGDRTLVTSMGPSLDGTASVEDEPMWRQTIVPSSAQAAQKGSQWSLWKLGHPSFSGFSEKVTAWQPFDAMRRTSAAMRP